MNETIIDLYNEIDAHTELEIVNIEMKSRIAITREDGVIFFDPTKVETAAQEKETLMEEIAHYEAYAFYPVDAPYNVWEKQEYRAKKQVFERRFPPEDIAVLMAHGYIEAYDIAEQLELTEDFVVEMLYYYKEIKGIDFAKLIDETGAIPPKKEYLEVDNNEYHTDELSEYLEELRTFETPAYFCLGKNAKKADVVEAYKIVIKYLNSYK